jgi:hypothetical protein
LEHFDQVVGDCFMDCVNCLIAFANNKISPQTSLKAIALLRICEDRLADVSLDVLVTSAGKLCIYHEYFGFQILFIDVRYSNCSSWSN